MKKKKKVAYSRTVKKAQYDPLKSPVISFGVVFFFILVIAVVAYAVKFFI